MLESLIFWGFFACWGLGLLIDYFIDKWIQKRRRERREADAIRRTIERHS